MASQSKGKKAIPIYVDPNVHREILVYATETGQTIQEVIKGISDTCNQSFLELVAQIKEMKRKAYEQQLKAEEDQRISSEHPLEVPGHEVEPILQ